MLRTNQIKKKLDNFTKKIKKKVEKYINSNNMIWIKEILLKLIYIEKKNLVR